MFVDACFAEGVVGPRGLFDEELDGSTSRLSPADSAELQRAASLRFPRVGTLSAAAADCPSHEWSRIESGVFTHELLSGLAGAADANGDGVVEYGEIEAFLAAANRDLRDPRARPSVAAHPPSADASAPLVSLASMRGAAFLAGDFSRLGHFYIELDDGERWLEANLASDMRGRLAFPADRRAFVVTRDREAPLFAAAGESLRVGSLALRPRDLTARGSVDESLREWLFATPFGLVYSRGFQDAVGFWPAGGDAAARAPAPSARTGLAIATWVASGLGLVGAGTAAALAMGAQRDYAAASTQRAAADARDRFERDRTAALAAGAGAAACGVVGWLLWPGSPRRAPAAVLPQAHGATVALEGTW